MGQAKEHVKGYKVTVFKLKDINSKIKKDIKDGVYNQFPFLLPHIVSAYAYLENKIVSALNNKEEYCIIDTNQCIDLIMNGYIFKTYKVPLYYGNGFNFQQQIDFSIKAPLNRKDYIEHRNKFK